MSRLDELIAKLCPDGVEYKPLGEMLDYEQPTKYIVHDTNYNNSYVTPVLTAGASFLLGYTNEEDNHYKASKSSPVIIFDDFTTAFQWVDFEFKVKSSAMKILKNRNDKVSDIRYVFFAMQEINFQSYTHSRHWIEKYSSFIIPLPPLPVQKEIVRILDSFTGLISELEAELAARRKQYEQCRDRIFDSDIGVCEQTTIGEICKKICSGGTPTVGNTKFYNGSIPWLRTQEVDWQDIVATSMTITEDGLANSSAKWIPANCVIVAMYGATAGKVAINKIPLTTNQACCNLEINDNMAEYKFVFYWLWHKYTQLKKLGQGTQSNINAAIVKKFPINLPTLPEQRRIISILDKFDALCNDETAGLVAEIAARKKQYEYYRDRLLDFKRKESA